DVDEQAVALDVVLRGRAGGERPEADTHSGQRLRRTALANADAKVVQRGLAVRMRPPGRGAGDADLAVDVEAGIVHPAGDRRPNHAGRPPDLDVHAGSPLTVQASQHPSDRDHAIRTVKMGANSEIVED